VPIQIEWEQREATPRFFCDQCGARIADAADGVALWEERDASEVGRRELFVTHTACRGDFERFRLSCTAGTWTVEDLAWFLLHLSNGVSFRVDEHAEWAAPKAAT
jgi:hypothetical protein